MRAFLERRRLRRRARHLLREGRHVRRLREDIAAAPDLARLDAAIAAVAEARRAADPAALEPAAARLGAAVRAICPPRPAAGLCENLEVLVVAVAVAMAIRTFFIQPFKIPTGSMQPTLHGVTARAQEGPAWHDRVPLNYVGWALFGEGYREVRAQRTGRVENVARGADFSLVVIDGRAQRLRNAWLDSGLLRVRPDDRVVRGQVLAAGRLRLGDHVFVNRLRSNFTRPQRGEILVFDTGRIDHPQVRPGYYIKRLCGMPGETVAIEPPYLVADGRRVTEPAVFRQLVEAQAPGYAPGHRPAEPFLPAPGVPLRLGPDEFLMLGDNTRASLDSRYFGPVRRESLVGPAFMVYWPLGSRWGRIR